jgi:hypothetical protein
MNWITMFAWLFWALDRYLRERDRRRALKNEGAK